MIAALEDEITLRPAVDADSAMVYKIRKAAVGQYVARVWGWDEAFQQAFHREHFDPATTKIIGFNGTEAGLIVEREESERILLESLHIRPAFQNRGIGTRLISEVIARARSQGKTVWLRVLKVNPAQHLYRRLGFQIIEETETHLVMEWKKPA